MTDMEFLSTVIGAFIGTGIVWVGFMFFQCVSWIKWKINGPLSKPMTAKDRLTVYESALSAK